MRYIYMDNSYKKEFKTKVQTVKDNKFAKLDNTIFYPNGGGQLYDTGKIIKADGTEVSVIYVGKFEGKISHQIEPEGVLRGGEEVNCILDWGREDICS